MPRPLPEVQSLREAVLEVINQGVGDPATRFISVTQYGEAPNLVEVCRNLINDPATLEYRENELRKYPSLLTIEDFVCRNGSRWRFDDATVRMACARVARCAFRSDFWR